MSDTLFYKIFTENTPLIDVRAPIEFSQGAFPNAINLPILNDKEREQIGICYKQSGASAATTLGHEIVNGELKSTRIEAWKAFIERQKTTYIYCFRGGQRSQIATSWLKDQGIETPRIKGGYKAMRRYLLGVLEKEPNITVVSGRTGVGKTVLLGDIDSNMIDLEGLANHRGSAFGRKASEQPSQIDFENNIAIAHLCNPAKIYLEDEGRMIGRLQVPISFQSAMQQADIILLEDSRENRVERIFNEYVLNQLRDFTVLDGLSPLQQLEAKYTAAVFAIKKRLGGVGFTEVSRKLVVAFEKHAQGEPEYHRDWITYLLENYYDPMYDYQLEKKQSRIIARGNHMEMKGFIHSAAD